ncbi:effector-associated domain EAD1-containing protein [Streptomyces sp. NPDC090306]|uniref:effector-associated domain EAD1-containing protein n=1 Tax=Streptomyces sp. NPDC090306 TaxID=3365961 RepID=UPI003825EB89
MRHFLDNPPFDWEVPAARELHEFLASCYDEPADVKAMAREAGVAVSQVSWQQPIHGIWRDLITAARNQNRLMALLARIEERPDAAVAERLRELLADRPVVESHEPETPASTWDAYTDPSSLERQIFPVATFQDVAFLRREAEQATPVCGLLLTVYRGERYHGTAFRVGHDLLLTNQHVLHAPDGDPWNRSRLGSTTSRTLTGATWNT